MFARGETVMTNCACEPEMVDLAVAALARSDADGGNRQASGDLAGEQEGGFPRKRAA